MEAKLKHLEMIQGVITRMASNSFLLKGWSVVLVSALFALSAKETNIFFICLVFFPALSFWELDGYFLWKERLYRKLYDKVRKMNESEIDFSMDTSTISKREKSWGCVTFSKTLRIFHGTIVGAIIILMLIKIKILQGG